MIAGNLFQLVDELTLAINIFPPSSLRSRYLYFYVQLSNLIYKCIQLNHLQILPEFQHACTSCHKYFSSPSGINVTGCSDADHIPKGSFLSNPRFITSSVEPFHACALSPSRLPVLPHVFTQCCIVISLAIVMSNPRRNDWSCTTLPSGKVSKSNLFFINIFILSTTSNAFICCSHSGSVHGKHAGPWRALTISVC